MRPLPDRLNDRLEQQIAFWRDEEQQGQLLDALGDDPEVDELVKLADQVQSAPFVEVSPVFASRLEQRLLLRNAELRRPKSAPARRKQPSWQPRPLLLVASIALLFVLLGTGVLAVAQAASPTSLLYVVKNWEQHVQISLANSPLDRAEVSRQIILDRLNSLADLTAPANTSAYYQALTDIDQQLATMVQLVSSLPSSSDQARLSNELAQTRSAARNTLRTILPRLTIAERLQTTAMLARLNDTVPRLQNVFMVISFHPLEQAVISVSGSDLFVGAQLFVDGRLVTNTGTLHNGVFVFVVSWRGTQSPHTVGILNPDGTAAQTMAITLVVPKDDQNNKNDNGKGDNGNGKKP